MKQNKFDNICIGILIGAAVIIMGICIVIASLPPKTTKANKYDMDCLTTPINKPLEECREAYKTQNK